MRNGQGKEKTKIEMALQESLPWEETTLVKYEKIMAQDLIIKKSKVHRKGVFANRDFKKGETVLHFEGDLYDAKEVPDQPYDLENDRYIQVSETKFVGPFRDGRDPDFQLPDNWVNHSCDPNCLTVSESNFKLKLVARREIKKGEEITQDYSTAMIFDSWTIKCNCGSPKCRKIITEFRSLPKTLRKQYIKERGIPTYFLKYVCD